MINKVFAIVFIILGGVFILLGILPARTSTLDSKRTLDSLVMSKMDSLARGNPGSITEERAHAIDIQVMKDYKPKARKTTWERFLVFMLIGCSIVLGGVALYKRSKKMSSLPEKSKISPLVQRQNRVFIWSVVVFVLLFITLCYFGMNSVTPLLLFLMLICFLGIVYFVRELIFFNDNFGDAGRHLVNWEYPNGDVVVITCWGLMKFIQEVPELHTSIKFEGVKWDFDNAKDLAESLLKGEGNPLMALVPSIGFSTTSNQVDDYIPFSFVDKVDLTFIDKDHGYLIVRIEKKYHKRKYTLSFPLPVSKASLATEAEIFDQRIAGRHSPVRALYIDKSLIAEINGEDIKPPDIE